MSFWTAVGAFFTSLVGRFWSSLKNVLSGAAEIVLAQLQDIALYAVTEVASTDMTSEDKRKTAFNKIKAYAETKKIAATSSLINLALEIAVQQLKKEA